MSTVKLGIAFFKACPYSIIDKSIRMWTRSKYSHVEFLFNTDVMFSSAPYEGTRFYRDYDLSNYDIFYIDVTKAQNEKLYHYCISENGCKYDWLGIILTQIVSMNRESKNKWFCSEFLIAGLKHIGIFPEVGIKSCRFSPEDVHQFIKLKSEVSNAS